MLIAPNNKMMGLRMVSIKGAIAKPAYRKLRAGEPADVPDETADWLLKNGHAEKAAATGDAEKKAAKPKTVKTEGK